MTSVENSSILVPRISTYGNFARARSIHLADNRPENATNNQISGSEQDPEKTITKEAGISRQSTNALLSEAPIDVEKAKYCIQPKRFPTTKIYSNDGIVWYRERWILNPHSWLYDPYPIDQRNSDEIREAVSRQDAMRSGTKTPQPILITGKDISMTQQDTKEARSLNESNLTPWTIVVPLTEEEKTRTSWLNPLGKAGYRLINSQEKRALPFFSFGKILLGWW